MRAQFKAMLCFVLVLTMLIPLAVIQVSAAAEPELTVDNYDVYISNAEYINAIRYASGVHTTTASIKAAQDRRDLSRKVIDANTADGAFVWRMSDIGYYTFWVRMTDGNEYFLFADIKEITPTVTADGLHVTVSNLADVRDFFIAEGEYDSYAQLKGKYIVRVTSAKIGTKNSYTYTVKNYGMHTVLVRFKDSSKADMVFKTELYVDEPVFIENGLQVTVDNIPGIKIIRTAPGKYDTASQVKAAQGCRNYPNRTVIKDAAQYLLQYREEGWVTIVAEYNNGYVKVHNYYVQPKVPAFTQNDDTVIIGDLDGLYVIRYVQGEYTTSSAIKNARGSKYLKARDINENGEIVITGLDEGKWSFVVQYDDESYNYYIITVEPKECPHAWGEWQVVTPATYKNDGMQSRSCSLCGAVEEEAVPMLICTAHSWCDWAVTKEATVEEEGREERQCFICGTVEARAIPKVDPIPVPTASGVGVSGAFSDNMILQRDEKLSVWGKAQANSGKVVVEFGGEYATAEVDSKGNWKAVFDTTFAYTTEGQPLKVRGAGTEIVFNNVLIGDVYYAVGQSNMFYSLGELIIDLRLNGRSNELQIDYNDERNMRFYRISSTDYTTMSGTYAQGTTTLYEDVYNGGRWMKPSDIAAQILQYANFTPASQTYNRDAISMEVFSAIGYIFAYNMTCRTDVPVGVIEIDASGHPLITFAPNELADKWGDDAYDAATGTYYYSMDTLSAAHLKSRYAYNQQIYPLSNFSTAGIIWYQGESDWYNTREYHGRGADTFATQFTELMEYFRSTFGNDDFPVYIFEYATCYSNNGKNAFLDFGSVKTELGTIPQILDNCHIVSTSDMWFDTTWLNNVHPYIKHMNAARLTDIVLADKFGIGDIELVSGPVLESTQYGATNVTLTFKNVGTGLAAAHPDILGTELRGIEIMVNTSGIYEWRDATGEIIVGKNKIVIDSDIQIFGVRYNRNAEASFPYQLNLCNSYGMPAIAFVDYKVNPVQAGTQTDIVRDGTPKKYFTMAFDDGVVQDAKIIEILKKYNVNCTTFYINTGCCGLVSDLTSLGAPGVLHKRWTLEELCSGVYRGYDVGVHSLTHPALNMYDNNPLGLKVQVEGDAINIENITGYQPVGMAYPGGDMYVSQTTINNILANTSIRFARGISSTGSFHLPSRFMMWQPTCHLLDGNLMNYAESFAKAKPTQDMLFYVWGHGYELDQYDFYDELEELVKTMAEAGDVVMVTNSEFYQLFKKQIPS